MNRLDTLLQWVSQQPRRKGRADYLKYLQGKNLNPKQSIAANCFRCNPDGDYCRCCDCPLLPFSPYSQT